MSNNGNKTIARLKQQAELIVKGHILNPFWNSREARRKKRYKATYSSLMNYLHRYADEIKEQRPEPVKGGDEPERAFTIWYQGEENAPELVKACFRSMRRNLKQELVVLDEKTLFDWISLPEHIVRKWKEGKIAHTQFSDICRVELLYQHGGLWLDATDYVTSPVPDFIMNEDLFIFMAGDKIRGAYAFIQSCFIRAKKGNPVLGIWREANRIYWREEDSKIDYFVHHLLLKLSTEVNPVAKEAISKMPKIDQDPTHYLWPEYCMDEYSREKYDSLTKDTFFQKTNYKDSRLRNVPKGSIAEYILNS
ncbi:MAG: capsular polysaccharide synthesis protein [Muribaculaceae bacterium]|nr:capsular polysaccharide synthesis protein [Muribaculaceae bacterium]